MRPYLRRARWIECPSSGTCGQVGLEAGPRSHQTRHLPLAPAPGQPAPAPGTCRRELGVRGDCEGFAARYRLVGAAGTSPTRR